MRGKKAKQLRKITDLIIGEGRKGSPINMVGKPKLFRYKKDSEGKLVKPLAFEVAEKGNPFQHQEGSWMHLYKGIKRNAKRV